MNDKPLRTAIRIVGKSTAHGFHFKNQNHEEKKKTFKIIYKREENKENKCLLVLKSKAYTVIYFSCEV